MLTLPGSTEAQKRFIVVVFFEEIQEFQEDAFSEASDASSLGIAMDEAPFTRIHFPGVGGCSRAACGTPGHRG